MNAIVCEAGQMSQEAATQFNSMSSEWAVDCSVDGDSYGCNVNIEGAEFVFTGSIVDGMVCDSTVTLNGEEVQPGGGEG